MSSGKHPFIVTLSKAFKAAADPANAVFQKAYMREQFEFFGIKTDIRRQITKEQFRRMEIPDHATLETVVKDLWALPQREYQYAAQELIVHHKKLWTQETIVLMEHCIVHKSWWDTIDYLNSYGSGMFFQKFPDVRNEITARWN